MDHPTIDPHNDDPEPMQALDFNDSKIAFSIKSDKDLKKMHWLFKLMNNNNLVSIGSNIGLLAIRLHIPFVELLLKKTIFQQFCGGENLLDCQQAIDNLYKFDTLTILDYGAEGKSNEDELNNVLQETIRAIEFAASNNSVPVVSTKISGLVENEILEKIAIGKKLTSGEDVKFANLKERLDKIGEIAAKHKVGIFVDAEESWIQKPIDELVMEMMEKYNKEEAIIYNTYQLYRHDKLEQLIADHKIAIEKGLVFGAKLVRGAYMEKERKRAIDHGYPSPIHKDKISTDKDFDAAVAYCMENIDTIASCCATHNIDSNLLQAKLIQSHGIDKENRHANFCQLYGMSDFITFNLAAQGFNVAKYVPYGPIRDVVPYLIRRAQENSSVTGELSRELKLIKKEIDRRGL